MAPSRHRGDASKNAAALRRLRRAKEAYLAEPEFDAVSLRQWRRDAGAVQQREPVGTAAWSFFFARAGFVARTSFADGRRRRRAVPPVFARRARAAAGFRTKAPCTRRLTKIEREAAAGDLHLDASAAARVFPGLSETAKAWAKFEEVRARLGGIVPRRNKLHGLHDEAAHEDASG